MHVFRSGARRLCLVLAVALLAAAPAQAQNRTQTARSFVPSPQVLAMGDAGVAVAGKETAFFYNPAHLTSVSLLRPRITLVGVQASVSNTTLRAGKLVEDNLEPLFDTAFFDPAGGDVEGADDRADQAAQLLGIYEDVVDLSEDGLLGGAEVLLPAVMLRAGPVALGGGLFTSSNVVFTGYDDGVRVLQDLDQLGAAVQERVAEELPLQVGLTLQEASRIAAPRLDFIGQADAMGLVSAAVDLGQFPSLPPLSVGLTTKYTFRVLYFESGEFPTIAQAASEYAVALCRRDPVRYTAEGVNCEDALAGTGAFNTEGVIGQDEEARPLSGSALSFDLGMQYEVPLPAVPGQVSLGLAALDLLSTDFDYTFDDRFPNSDVEEGEEAAVRAEEERANRLYNLSPQYRLGVAYTAPEVPFFLSHMGVTMEVLLYDEPRFRRDFANRFRMGLQGRLLNVLSVRAGLGDRHPSLGLGLSLGLLHLDYALYAHESQVEAVRYNHTLQVVLRLF